MRNKIYYMDISMAKLSYKQKYKEIIFMNIQQFAYTTWFSEINGDL